MTFTKWVLLIMVCAAVAAQARACRARCENHHYSCSKRGSFPCPSRCPRICYVNCKRCKVKCPVESTRRLSEASLSAACDKPGAVCHDPRFIGGESSMFYFHGKKGKDFCLVSDKDLHINAHFMGKSATQEQELKHDLTWVKSIGVRFGSHQIYLGANKVARWESALDQLTLLVDGQSVLLPPRRGAQWEDRLSPLKITRVLNVNAVILQVPHKFSLTAWVVPVTAEESRVHGYGMTEDDCLAHLQLNFKFCELSPNVNGVLGQTYSSGFKSHLKVGGVMEGEDKFAVSHLFATDCKVARFVEGMESRLGFFRLSPTV
ncbi:uncharacterized protein LOC131045127 [Cryptomeria japonica]|uniref:uncharacterized protein LOC131045127 n=1 Tax=Cryptomeria japonica TaxID=3369 RepID=UPI0025ABF887|nr:uncharacterized protein LOC131045127 [Cryptomeria japonica]